MRSAGGASACGLVRPGTSRCGQGAEPRWSAGGSAGLGSAHAAGKVRLEASLAREATERNWRGGLVGSAWSQLEASGGLAEGLKEARPSWSSTRPVGSARRGWLGRTGSRFGPSWFPSPCLFPVHTILANNLYHMVSTNKALTLGYPEGYSPTRHKSHDKSPKIHID